MPLTFDGRLVQPGRNEAPTLRDIALSLSRIPRFGGHTRRWWSVLDHSVFVYLLAVEMDKREYHDLSLALLLHDAHETMTGDVPSDVKLQAMRQQQSAFDVEIVREHFPLGMDAWMELKPFVKEYDRRALHAEAWLLGPPGLMDADDDTYERLYGFGKRPFTFKQDCNFLARVRMDTTVFQSRPDAGINGLNVRQFILKVQALQNLIAEQPHRLLVRREPMNDAGSLGQPL